MEPNRPTITPQGVVGVFIVLLGIVFTLDNLGLVQSHQILQYWPLAPIGVGLLIIIHAEATRDWIKGTVWLAAGVLFLANNLGWLRFRIEAFWPLLLVALGLHIIFRSQETLPNRMEREQQRMQERLLRRKARWERKLHRWQEHHGGEAAPPWAQDWSAKWQEKWLETQAKFQESQAKFHEEWQKHHHEDWQDRLKHTMQSFAGKPPERDVDVPVDVHVDGVGTPYGAPPSGSGAAGVGVNANASAGAGATGQAGASASAGAGAGTGAGAGVGGFASGSWSTPGGEQSGWGHPHRISMFALMSGVSRRVIGMPFRGAAATAVMGGIELDLRQATLPDDAVIDLFAFWGGIEIVVPRDWIVVNQGFALMGGIEDKTGNVPRPGGPRLFIRGMALMGGVEIKNPRM
jgi:hypothetical protein